MGPSMCFLKRLFRAGQVNSTATFNTVFANVKQLSQCYCLFFQKLKNFLPS